MREERKPNLANFLVSCAIAASLGVIVYHETHSTGYTAAGMVFAFFLSMIFYNKVVRPVGDQGNIKP